MQFVRNDTLSVISSFSINPTTIPAIYILTYQGVTGPAGLYGTLGTSATPVVYSQPTQNLVLHLYSERPSGVSDMDHIELFNGMFDRAGDGQPLNLVHDKNATEGDLADIDKETVPDYLSREDLKTICELGLDQYARQPAPCLRVADPAGCSNGWVFLDS